MIMAVESDNCSVIVELTVFCREKECKSSCSGFVARGRLISNYFGLAVRSIVASSTVYATVRRVKKNLELT